MDIENLANSFIEYLKLNNITNIPYDFIREYYILSHGKYVSLYECTLWLNIKKHTIVESLKNNFKKDTDYYETSYDNEKDNIKLYNKNSLIYNKNYKYILLTTMCFRDICLRSLTKKGKIIRTYNIKIEDLFKDFHLNYINKLNKENEIILHNQKKIKLTHDEGIYVFREVNDNSNCHKLGKAEDIYGRIAQHNSSHKNKIIVEIIIYTKCSTQIEIFSKNCLENYLYRGEYYKCDMKIIENVIKDSIKLLKKYNANCICENNEKKCNQVEKYKKLSKKSSNKTIKK
jgi:hypothetical protein